MCGAVASNVGVRVGMQVHDIARGTGDAIRGSMLRLSSLPRLPYVAAVLVAAGLAFAPTGADAAQGARAPSARPTPTHAYVVKAGDGGWFQIAHAQGVTMQQLLQANHATTTTRVNAGQKLNVPGKAKPKVAARPTPAH
jgi:LysM domain